MFAAISGSDAAGAAAVGRMTIDRLVESGYPRPYACALVAAGACTGILIPPSIAYIIIGLVLGISASDPVFGRTDPWVWRFLCRSWHHQHHHEPLYGYEGGGIDLSMNGDMAGQCGGGPRNPAGTLSSCRDHLLRHLLGAS